MPHKQNGEENDGRSVQGGSSEQRYYKLFKQFVLTDLTALKFWINTSTTADFLAYRPPHGRKNSLATFEEIVDFRPKLKAQWHSAFCELCQLQIKLLIAQFLCVLNKPTGFSIQWSPPGIAFLLEMALTKHFTRDLDPVYAGLVRTVLAET